MTTENLQSLIADLDRLLSQKQERLSWSTSDNWTTQQQTRQVLGRVRAYLATLPPQSESTPPLDTDLSSYQDKLVEQITSSVVAQVNHQLSDWFDSLGTELEGLRQQRQSLEHEIQHLQQQYQQMIADFIQLLMRRSQDVLLTQITQTQETIAQQLRVSINPSEILQQLIELQRHSDQLLSHLDTTFRSVFETLEQDLQGYSQSLCEGLERMHSLGQQGEVKLLAYINRLTEELEQSSQAVATLDSHELVPDSTTLEENSQPPQVETIRLLTDLIPSTTYNPSKSLGVALETTDAEYSQQHLSDDQEPLLVPSSPPEEILSQSGWYLGIDFGSSSLTAVLSKINKNDTEGKIIQEYPLYWSSGQAASFRLPTTAYSSSAQTTAIELENLKSLLNQTSSLPPEIRLVLVNLFLTLNTEINLDSLDPIAVMTNGLPQSSLQNALKQLEGVILNMPTGWGETYRSHLKEMVSAANLVEDEKQIFFVEEAIATLLAHLPDDPSSSLFMSPTKTLVINSGATTTDLALVTLTNPIQSLCYDDFLSLSLAYGGNALEQDIFCQLIYPQWLSQLHHSFVQLAAIVPQPGTPDPLKREQLKQRLQDYSIGGSFLEAAKLAKLILQQQESFTSQLGNQPWSLRRQDVEKTVINPFLECLEAQINGLLTQNHLSPHDIGQVIASGGTTLTLWYALSAWIKEKFQRAIVFHDDETENISTVATGLARLPLFPNVRSR